MIEDYEWLAVQFDNAGRVVFHEFSDDNQGCLSNGICHIKGLFSELESKTVLTAPAVLDDQARQYRARSGECAVYFYQQPKIRLRAANYPVELFVDNRLYGITSYETYLFFTRPAGNIRLGAYQFEMDLNCLSGKAYYIKVVEGWTVKEGESLAIETDDAGIQAISKRRLALSE